MVAIGHVLLGYVPVTQILAIFLKPKKQIWPLSRSFSPHYGIVHILAIVRASCSSILFNGLNITAGALDVLGGAARILIGRRKSAYEYPTTIGCSKNAYGEKFVRTKQTSRRNSIATTSILYSLHT